ncbi:MAG: acyl-CoA desaturase [Myxococcales bacterium]|nr:acyl-CoA desaturase [Myxococcales bacterium]
MAIAIFFVGHWVTSVFFQTFFLHRYASHRQFTMSKGWERFFHLCTYLAQGSSFLSARGYAILHRMHHAYSDSPKDPHSPENHKNVFAMMWATKKRYDAYTYRLEAPEPRFEQGLVEWPALERLRSSWVATAAWLAAYTLFYAVFATHWWMWLLLPVHFMMGPLHGSIVNWCGHRYGYRNFESDDVSRNTLFFDFLTLGELFQNNHHKYAMRPNFAVRRFEIDPTFHVMRALAWLGVIQLKPFRELDEADTEVPAS